MENFYHVEKLTYIQVILVTGKQVLPQLGGEGGGGGPAVPATGGGRGVRGGVEAHPGLDQEHGAAGIGLLLLMRRRRGAGIRQLEDVGRPTPRASAGSGSSPPSRSQQLRAVVDVGELVAEEGPADEARHGRDVEAVEARLDALAAMRLPPHGGELVFLQLGRCLCLGLRRDVLTCV